MKMEKFTEAMSNVYGWKVVEEDGKQLCKLDIQLPDFVQKRIEYFILEAENGATFIGVLNWILENGDVEKLKEEFEYGSSRQYLPASDEFKAWINEFGLMNIRQQEIAVALIYGSEAGEI